MLIQPHLRWILSGLLVSTAVTLLLGFVGAAAGWSSAGKLVTTSGLLATIAGVVQLEVSGLLDKVLQHFADEVKYPYGPPSHITRQLIDNPDTPIRTGLRNILFFNLKTGFWLIIGGTTVQVFGAWL